MRSLRARQVGASYQLPANDPLRRARALWTICTDIATYGLSDALTCDFTKTTELAHVPTRLRALSSRRQEQLIHWGFAVTDAALRTYYDCNLLPAGAFPYSGGVD